jgi:hypothetical protein
MGRNGLSAGGALGPDFGEADMAARAAWPHDAGGVTQSDIAKRFGAPTTRARRMIARAVKAGLVRITVAAGIAGCVALAERLKRLFGLSACSVAPDLGETTPLPLRARLRGRCAARLDPRPRRPAPDRRRPWRLAGLRRHGSAAARGPRRALLQLLRLNAQGLNRSRGRDAC